MFVVCSASVDVCCLLIVVCHCFMCGVRWLLRLVVAFGCCCSLLLCVVAVLLRLGCCLLQAGAFSLFVIGVGEYWLVLCCVLLVAGAV